MPVTNCTAIVVVLNAGELLQASLTSLRNLPVDEIIFVDGGSADGTAERLRDVSDVRLIEMPKQGVTARLLAGVRAARNELLLLVCDDDQISPEALSKTLEQMVSRPELDGLQFQISTPVRNFWERGWSTYFSIITAPGKAIPLLGRPCVAKRSNFLELRDPPSAFGDDTWIHLQEIGKPRIYEVGPGLTMRTCPSTLSWNVDQFRKYGEADNGVSAKVREHLKLFFHTAVRIGILRSLRALLSGKPGPSSFIFFMGLSRTYYHLKAWILSAV